MRLTKKQALPLLILGFVFLLAAAVLLYFAVSRRSDFFVFLTIVATTLCGLFFFLREAFTKGPRERYKDAAKKEEDRRNGRQFEEEGSGDAQ